MHPHQPPPPPPPPPPRPWDRRPGESDREWQAFSAYLALGAIGPDGLPGRRTYTEVARRLGLHDHSHVGAMGRVHEWKPRAAAYDSWIRAERDSVMRDEIADMTRRHADLARRLLRLAEREIVEMEERQDGGIPVAENIGDLVTLLREAQKMERLAAGVSTENVAIRGRVEAPNEPAGYDLEGMSLAALEELEQARARARGREPAPLTPPRPPPPPPVAPAALPAPGAALSGVVVDERPRPTPTTSGIKRLRNLY